MRTWRRYTELGPSMLVYSDDDDDDDDGERSAPCGKHGGHGGGKDGGGGRGSSRGGFILRPNPSRHHIITEEGRIFPATSPFLIPPKKDKMFALAGYAARLDRLSVIKDMVNRMMKEDNAAGNSQQQEEQSRPHQVTDETSEKQGARARITEENTNDCGKRQQRAIRQSIIKPIPFLGFSRKSQARGGLFGSLERHRFSAANRVFFDRINEDLLNQDMQCSRRSFEDATARRDQEHEALSQFSYTGVDTFLAGMELEEASVDKRDARLTAPSDMRRPSDADLRRGSKILLLRSRHMLAGMIAEEIDYGKNKKKRTGGSDNNGENRTAATTIRRRKVSAVLSMHSSARVGTVRHHLGELADNVAEFLGGVMLGPVFLPGIHGIGAEKVDSRKTHASASAAPAGNSTIKGMDVPAVASQSWSARKQSRNGVSVSHTDLRRRVAERAMQAQAVGDVRRRAYNEDINMNRMLQEREDRRQDRKQGYLAKRIAVPSGCDPSSLLATQRPVSPGHEALADYLLERQESGIGPFSDSLSARAEATVCPISDGSDTGTALFSQQDRLVHGHSAGDIHELGSMGAAGVSVPGDEAELEAGGGGRSAAPRPHGDFVDGESSIRHNDAAASIILETKWGEEHTAADGEGGVVSRQSSDFGDDESGGVDNATAAVAGVHDAGSSTLVEHGTSRGTAEKQLVVKSLGTMETAVVGDTHSEECRPHVSFADGEVASLTTAPEEMAADVKKKKKKKEHHHDRRKSTKKREKRVSRRKSSKNTSAPLNMNMVRKQSMSVKK